MKQIRYLKTENIIEDTCLIYGLCKILKDNEVNYTLITKKSCYVVEYDEEDIDEDGLVWNDLELEDMKSVGSVYFTELTTGALKKINTWFNENINNILIDIQDFNVLNKNTEPPIAVGTHFYTLSNAFSPTKTSAIKRNLSFLGYTTYTTLVKCESHELNFLMIPAYDSKIKNIIKPSEIIIIKKDKTEFICQNFDKGNFKKSEVELQAIIYLKTLKQFYYEKSEYESVFVMTYKRAGNKPMADKSFTIDILNVSIDSILYFEKLITFSKSYDVKDSTAKFIINRTYSNFSKMMKYWAKEFDENRRDRDKKDQKIEKSMGEELINMYSEKIKKIYFNENIQKMGRCLNNMVRDNKGFNVLAKLYNVKNATHISTLLNVFSDEYYRHTKGKYSLLNNAQIEDVLNLINDSSDAKIVADAIISYGRNFYIKKETIKQIEQNVDINDIDNVEDIEENQNANTKGEK